MISREYTCLHYAHHRYKEPGGERLRLRFGHEVLGGHVDPAVACFEVVVDARQGNDQLAAVDLGQFGADALERERRPEALVRQEAALQHTP